MTRRTPPNTHPPTHPHHHPFCHCFHVAFSSSFTSLISLPLSRQPQHPACIVLRAGRYKDGVLAPAEEPFTGTEPAEGDLQLPQLYEPCRQYVFPKQFNSLITHSHTHSLSRTLTNVLSWQQLCGIAALKMNTSCFCLHILSSSTMVF